MGQSSLLKLHLKLLESKCPSLAYQDCALINADNLRNLDRKNSIAFYGLSDIVRHVAKSKRLPSINAESSKKQVTAPGNLYGDLCSSNFLHARLCIVKVLGNEAQKISDEGAGDLLVVLLVHHDIRIEDLPKWSNKLTTVPSRIS